MGKGLIIGVGVALTALVVLLVLWGSYVNLVGKDEMVIKRNANLQAIYQRSLDEVDADIAAMKLEPLYYDRIYVHYAEAREGYEKAKTTGDATQLDKGISGLKSEVNNILNAIVVRQESVPPVVLKQIQALTDAVANIESIKNQERRLLNDAVQNYRQTVRTTPWAGMLGFDVDEHKPFEAQPGADRPDYKGRIEGGK